MMLKLELRDRQTTTHHSVSSLPSSDANERVDDLLKRHPQSFPRRTYLPSHVGTLWLITSGVVRTLSYLEDGSSVTLGLWSQEDIVGRSLSEAESYSIETLTPAKAIPVSSKDWQPSAEALLRYFQQTEKLMLIRTNRRAETILLSTLNWLAHKFGRQIEQGYLIDLKLTHQDLAELTGLTRVTVTRLLRQLEDQGLIYRHVRQLILAQSQEQWHYEI